MTDFDCNVVSSDKSEDLIGYVIENAIIETSADAGDEFWKPVTRECYKEGDISACDEDENFNINRYSDSNESWNRSDRDFFEGNTVRKAISDESLSFQRHETIQNEIFDDALPLSQSEKTSPEMKSSNRHQRQRLYDSGELDTDTSDEDYDYTANQFDFFREYEIKVDMLEYCDMAMEESLELLKHIVLDLVDLPKKYELIEKLECKRDEDQKCLKQLIKDEQMFDAKEESRCLVLTKNKTETQVSENTTEETLSNKVGTMDNESCQDSSDKKENSQIILSVLDDSATETVEPKEPEATEQAPGGLLQQKANLVAEALVVLKNRYEKFVSTVSDTIHLGALSVRHGCRVDQWGAEVQRTYQKIYTDHQRMKNYLEESEIKWAESRDQYQAEIIRQGQQINNILQKLHIQNDVPETPRRHNDRRRTAEIVNEVLLNRRCQEEQAMALDFSRQAKITEQKLIIIHQQAAIQRLQLKNKELDSIIRDVLCPDYEKSLGDSFDQDESVEDLDNISDVLMCDESCYLPNKSCELEVVGRSIFHIGDLRSNRGPLSPQSPRFDPQKLSYICLDNVPMQSLSQIFRQDDNDDGDDAPDDECNLKANDPPTSSNNNGQVDKEWENGVKTDQHSIEKVDTQGDGPRKEDHFNNKLAGLDDIVQPNVCHPESSSLPISV